MKRILFIALICPLLSLSQSQIKVQALPTTTVGIAGDFLIKDKAAGGSGATQKIAVDKFIQTYSLTTNGIATVSLTGAGTTTVTAGGTTTAPSFTISSSGGTGTLAGTLTDTYIPRSVGSYSLVNSYLRQVGDGIHLLDGKYFTSADSTKIRMDFGSSGSYYYLTTDGATQNTANIYIDQTNVGISGGNDFATRHTDLALGSGTGSLSFTEGALFQGFSVHGNSSTASVKGGVGVVNNSVSMALSSINDQKAGVFINAKNDTVNNGIYGVAMFGTGLRGKVANTAYGNNLDIKDTIRYRKNPVVGYFLKCLDVSGNGIWAASTGTASHVDTIIAGANITVTNSAKSYTITGSAATQTLSVSSNSVTISGGNTIALNTTTITAGTGISAMNSIYNSTVSISTGYAGQTSITTTGTVSTGTWNSTITPPGLYAPVIASNTVTIDGHSTFQDQDSTTSSVTTLTVTFSNIVPGEAVLWDYWKTTTSNLVLTFPTGVNISVSSNALTTAGSNSCTLVSATTTGKYSIYITRKGLYRYMVSIAKDID